MERVAQFEEVSRQQFYSDMSDNFGIADVESENVYKNVRMPKRATSGSAGYDFYIPFNLELSSGKSVRIPTGVRCRMNPGWVLQIALSLDRTEVDWAKGLLPGYAPNACSLNGTS